MDFFFDFEIKENGAVSSEFLRRDIHTFRQASIFVQDLKYGRNKDKSNLLTVFDDNCATCSTKHGLLKLLADENGHHEINLILGLFRMDSQFVPKIKSTLEQYGLAYIPEAHNYLRYGNKILDVTNISSNSEAFLEQLIEEKNITASQITDYKVNYHKEYLQKWLNEDSELKYTLDEIWEIREKCIKALSDN